jgi:hypothetical protein
VQRHLNRAIQLARRYQVDRRLPPPVTSLVRDVARLRVVDRVQRWLADLPPGVRSGAPVQTARLGHRRLATTGALETSFDDLRHRYARDITERLTGAGIDVFITGERGDHLQFGILLSDRPAALRAITTGETDRWYLEFDIGRSTSLVPLARAAGSRRVAAARSWRLFRPASWADRAVGADQAVELTFWGMGSSGMLELIGTRGHERFDERSEPTVELIGGHAYPGRSAFPVGRSLERLDAPVDIVYTWVDGADAVWRSAFERHSRLSGRNLGEGAFDEARFRSRDELLYSLRSVWAFAGWARHIFVVTAGQRPRWLVDHPRVTVVDHADILPADALPTFNSHAIEAALHRIEGLAEHFIYFNDDVFLGRPLRPEFFFTPNGLARVFLSRARVPGFVDDHSLDVDRAAERGRQLLESRYGRVAGGKPYHTPFPLLRSVLGDLEDEFPDAVKGTIHSRFRAPTDVSVAASFAQHYALATRRAVLGDLHTEYVHFESDRLDWYLDRIRLGGDVDTFCINETEQPADDSSSREQRVRAFFDDYLPIAAPWETKAVATRRR